MIGQSDSLVANPFVEGPRTRRCQAFDELLSLVLTDDLDFDRVHDDYHRMLDERRGGLLRSTPVERQLLICLAEKHNVGLDESLVDAFSIDALHIWLRHHARQMLTGHSLLLVCDCVVGDCPFWTCHGQSLAGALLWLCSEPSLSVCRAFVPLSC